jgi:dephospho-CoA kinase
MLKLGLTGSIAVGKSTVLAVFADQNIPTFSSDEAVHALYRGVAVPPVAAAFPGVVTDGEIDRAALSAILVVHPERLKDLEAIVHPLVRAEISRFLATAQASGADLAVVDIPLLYERGIDWGFDKVLVVAVDPATQRVRALARPGMNVEKLDAILARQLPQAEKLKRADCIIWTDGSLEETRRQVLELIQSLRTGR